MKKTILFFCLAIAFGANAQREKAEAYVVTYREVAMKEMLRSGVPAAITLAQGILESQYGESDLVKSSNNHFGIKCKTEWTGPKVYHDDDEKGECFRVYASAEDSYTDHSDFLRTRPHYAFLFQLDPTDFEGWANGLKKAGYATTPTYPQKLLKVIADYNLQKYTLQALAFKTGVPGAGMLPEPNTIANVQPVTSMQGVAINGTGTVAFQAQTKEPVNLILPDGKGPAIEQIAATGIAETAVKPGKIEKSSAYPNGIFQINHTKVIFATEGTSLLSLANQYDIPLSKLLEYNELAEMDVLDKDRLMYMEKKSKKGNSDYHVVAAGETLYSISQQEGVRLENILEYNKLKKESVTAPGDKVYLRLVPAVITPAKSL